MKGGIRWPQTVAILSALSILQAAVLDQFWLGGRVRIDLLLLVVVSVGWSASARDAALFGFVTGLFVDLLRFGPFGLHALIFCLAGWALANNGARMLQVGAGFRAIRGMAAVLLLTAATWVAGAVFGQRPSALGDGPLLTLGLVALVGGLVLLPIERLAAVMVPSAPRRTPTADVVRTT
jgi:rod shape-determining protein MreD